MAINTTSLLKKIDIRQAWTKVRSSEDDTGDDSCAKPRHDWNKGVCLCAKATVGLLLLNIILISIAGGLASQHPGFGGFLNFRIIFDGSRTTVSGWNTALHIIINVLSTCILGASNYCMQTLVAPTRHEVDIYHAKRRSLDIGGSSFRNLFAISYGRLGLWAMLLITATPFHLLYNAMIFESDNVHATWMLISPHDLDTQNVRNLASPTMEKCFRNFAGTQYLNWDQQVIQITESKSKRISTEECYEYIYATTQNPSYKGFILLATNFTTSHGADIPMLESTEWIPNTQSLATYPFVNLSRPATSPRECYNGSDYSNIHINECLAFEGNPNSQLLFNPLIGVIVVLATLTKAVVMFLAARFLHSQAPPLLTTGDAVASFLERTDYTTKGMCWASSESIKKGTWISFSTASEGGQSPVSYRRLSPPMRWRKASNPFRWIVTILIFSGGIIVGLISFGEGLAPTLRIYSISQVFSQLWDKEGGGGLYQERRYGSIYELQGVLITNCAQLAVTIGYYFYNSVLTNMLLAAEYSSYGVDRKPLRVTRPVEDSQQRSTYWLSIPYRYGIPIMLVFTLIHWLVSQGFYYSLIIPYDLEGHFLYEYKMGQSVFSIMPILFAALLSLLTGIVLVGLSFRRLKSNMPLAGSCSAAISAACHPPNDVCKDTAALGELSWGETRLPMDRDNCRSDRNDAQKGHCSFTPSDVRQPSLDKLYA